MVESRRVKILSKKPHGSFLLANIQRHSYNDVLLHCFPSSLRSNKGSNSPKPVFIPSHRLILSTISPLLAGLLADEANTSADNPVIISLPDTDPQVLSFLLDFAYCGKTTVPLKHLDGISETSKRLRIKYLENAIVKVERAPTNASSPPSVAILKPLKGNTPKKLETGEKKLTKGGVLPQQDASSTSLFQPRKRTTKIRKVLIPKSNKGTGPSSGPNPDLPVVDLEECKPETMIKSDGTHIQVLRHPSTGLVLQPVNTFSATNTPAEYSPGASHTRAGANNNANSNNSNAAGSSESSSDGPTTILGGGPLAAVSKGFTITSPTVGVGYQGSRVLVQKTRSIALNHEGEEIIHCEKGENDDIEEQEVVVNEEEVQVEGGDVQEEEVQEEGGYVQEEEVQEEGGDVQEEEDQEGGGKDVKEEKDEITAAAGEEEIEETVIEEKVPVGMDEEVISDVKENDDSIQDPLNLPNDQEEEQSHQEPLKEEEEESIPQSEVEETVIEEGEELLEEELEEDAILTDGVIPEGEEEEFKDPMEEEDLLYEEEEESKSVETEDEEEAQSIHHRTSGRVRKMNPKYFSEDNVSSSDAVSATTTSPCKDSPLPRKRARTLSENNATHSAIKKKK
eukprot:TRINITY_DN1749_c0_g1_i4.p1 TRINITY_DN1749_c0_g1~~TRINITY_DN1749_c0_g1_i4.p1  ORF type:complete len:637 (-),score=268.17 TRINITY_DN1749_c0_g1_i4:657-2522(-)